MVHEGDSMEIPTAVGVVFNGGSHFEIIAKTIVKLHIPIKVTLSSVME